MNHFISEPQFYIRYKSTEDSPLRTLHVGHNKSKAINRYDQLKASSKQLYSKCPQSPLPTQYIKQSWEVKR